MAKIHSLYFWALKFGLNIIRRTCWFRKDMPRVNDSSFYFTPAPLLPPFAPSFSFLRTPDRWCPRRPGWNPCQPWRPCRWRRRSSCCARPTSRRQRTWCCPDLLFLRVEIKCVSILVENVWCCWKRASFDLLLDFFKKCACLGLLLYN